MTPTLEQSPLRNLAFETGGSFPPSLPMTGQNIICFAKDWSEDPTSCNHVMRELAKHNKVLWLNSISTRSPNLASGRDLRKIGQKLAALLRGPRTMGENLWVYTPFVLPFHHRAPVVAANRSLLRFAFRQLRRRLGMGRFQLWTFVPTSAQYVGDLDADLLVYYCTDNWSQFSTVDGAKVGAMVQALAEKADVVFATSQPLVDKLAPHNPQTHLSAHGVKHAMFARAVEDNTPLPPDLAALPGPVLGFYGLIEDWMDQGLIAFLAERHPEWTFAFVGRVCVDVSRLEKFPNVHFLGRKPHNELPGYCKGFAVGLIPHKVNELTVHMNPIKLREYISAGLPIVSTDLPEMRHYADHCAVARTYEEFEQGVQATLEAESPERRRRRSATMRDETWDKKVARLGEIVMGAMARRRR